MYKNKTIQYIDYDIDILVKSDFSYKIVDQDEFEENRRRFQYPKSIECSISQNLAELEKWINNRKDPFNEPFKDYWYKVFLNRRKK